jgi:hypothetical protein
MMHDIQMALNIHSKWVLLLVIVTHVLKQCHNIIKNDGVNHEYVL